STSFNTAPVVTNCIFWGNSAPQNAQVDVGGSAISVTYCDVQGGLAGAGNIAADPWFFRNPGPGADGQWGTTDDDFGDLRISPISLVVDAGKNAAVPAGTTVDFI